VEWVAFADGREEELYRYGVDATVTVAQPHTFEGTRQILAGCDAVVSVDTSLGHVAGAMGIPTALLLSADPDSRWGMTGRTTRWYPSVTLCRQSVIGDWASAITQAEEWLT
jgi:ADP-heptose:LPS heptosyltransferase